MYEKEEIRRLRKENRQLKKRVAALQKESHTLPPPENASTAYNENNYFAFLLARIRGKNFYNAVKKYLKPSLWVSRIFLWGVTLYKYIQAGAFVLIYTAAFILIIPVLLVITALTLITTLILRSRNAKKLLKKLQNDVVFIIPDGKDGFDVEFLREKCKEYPASTVLLVSPFFLGKTGVCGKKMYVCFREEDKDVFILRNYFFFYFRKKLKNTSLRKVTEIRVFGDKEI